MKTYSITRHFFDKDNEVTKRGLTLEEAQAHCRDPETSSTTTTNDPTPGIWFDGYGEDE